MTDQTRCGSAADPVPTLRMRSQRLSAPWPGDPASLVAWMGAVQAQDARMARWAVGVRMARPDAPAVRCALEQGRIVRMHLLRPTWHLVAREDVRWMLRLCAPRIRAANDSYARGQGLALDERLFRRAHGAIARALEGGQAFTREEIGALLAGEGFPSDTCAVRRILMRGETDGVLCSGPDRGRNPTYALLDERVPAGAPCPEGDDALALLALRYFGSHAPATLADFVWWSGLPLREARRAVWLAGDGLAEETFGRSGETWIVCRSFPAATAALSVVHLLPAYDEYLIAYRQRSHVLDPHHYADAFNAWGIFRPVILSAGRVAGNWTPPRSRKGVPETAIFPDAPAIPASLLSAAADRYCTFEGA
ncbi:MAG: winged helix DNA-binding domain-containing protein [Alistipes sp.]|mgnify:FL=1|uniref:winged helix DNA-binding domain-containing protein n=1 Tax=Alistipes sp. TaxID=1872444 RepID=UPI001D59E2AB|nr:winged helix DNA-binding domain-containing protein [Alistipes sp.]MBS6100615.1 AlkZ family DNA glycosylase [Alistipes sp.]HJI18698.1 winged helix DNA-binding domain-containing protein [Rikenellaceae bacterium]